MTKRTEQISYITNFDLGLTAALILVGYPLLRLDKTNIKKVQFILASKDGIDEAIQNYFANNLQVDAQSYFNTIKMLKNRIYIN